MTKEDYIAKIEGFLKNDNFGNIITEYNDSCRQFIKESKKLRKQLLEEHVEAGGEEEGFAAPIDKYDNRFKELQKIFGEKKRD